MKAKRMIWMPLIATLILSTLTVGMVPVQASNGVETLALFPDIISVEKDNETVALPNWPNFDVNVTITNVTDVIAVTFSAHWDPSILDLTGVVKGDFLDDGFAPSPTIDHAGGNLKEYAITQLSPYDPKNYTYPDWGWVATLEFQFVGTAPPPNITTTITLVDNPAADMDTMCRSYGEPVAGHNFDVLGTCEFTYVGPPAVGGDVAVINVVPSESQAYQAWTINVNVTVLNNGTDPISFNVTAYYENVTAAYEIGTQPVTDLAGGAQMNRTFNWALSGVALGLYDLKANATLIGLEDINLNNNEFVVYDAVKVKMPGDVDGSAKVDYIDLFALAAAYGAEKGDPRYNLQADFNVPGKVDYLDLFALAATYGQSTPEYPPDP